VQPTAISTGAAAEESTPHHGTARTITTVVVGTARLQQPGGRRPGHEHVRYERLAAMAWQEVRGERIYYESTGRGDAVLLLPGWAGSIIEFGQLRQELSMGFRVIAADLPGSGRSEPQPRQYAPTFYLDDAQTFRTLLDALDVDAAHLVGFSDGGEVALLMASLRPGQALSVVTWGAAGQVVAPPAGQLDAIENLVDDPAEPLADLAAYLVEAYGVDIARAMASSWGRALRAIIEEGGDISFSRAADIRCPSLLLTGTDDPVCPPSLVQKMADAMPHSTFREVPGAAHDIHRSHQRWLTSAIATWLGDH
jgi:pimeloyl-ACP methyl ester carboxylesterase